MDYRQRKDIEGLGGWLFLIMCVVLCSPFLVISEIMTVYPPIFQNWSSFTTNLQNIMIVELVINILIIGMWIVVATLFFSKSSKFPGYFIGLLLFCVGVIFLDAYVTSLVFGGPILDKERGIRFFSTSIKSAVYMLYIVSSDRVYNTFLRYKM